MKRAKQEALLLQVLVRGAALLTVGALLGILAYVLYKGVPNMKPSLFSLVYNSENCSLLPAAVNTVTMAILALAMAVPVGVGAAVFLVEYAPRGNRLVRWTGLTAETLSGIPSIVYGLFGYLLFNIYLGWGYSLLGGACTLAIMVLPVVMRTAQEALKAVPDSYREGSFGLGAGRLRTVMKVVLPPAVPGIAAGVVLSMGRIVGETAALIFTAGTMAQIPKCLLGSGRTLAVHMYALWNEGLSTGPAYATAVILLLLVAGLNALSGAVAKQVGKEG